MPLGVIGLPAAMALYPAFGFMLARLFWTRGPARILAFAAALTLTEWLRGNLFTGFPWNAFGMAFGGNLVAAQFASLVGLYGLTLVAIADLRGAGDACRQTLEPARAARPAARRRSRLPDLRLRRRAAGCRRGTISSRA